MSFVHLHVHSHYSILDGACKIPELVDKASRAGMPGIALTDHGNLFGAIDFYDAARAANITPILGYEAYIAIGSRTARGRGHGGYYHLTLLVENRTGYQNLLKIATESYLNGFYYKPRIDNEFLAEHSEGLICLTGCLRGELAQRLIHEEHEEADKLIEFYRECFGDRLYAEYQFNGIDLQKKYLEALIPVAKRHNLPTVITNDVHYLDQEDAIPHDALLCIQTGKKIADPKRLRFSTNDFFLKTPEQMRQDWRGHEDSLLRTVEVAERCSLEIPMGEIHLPRFAPPDDSSMEHYFYTQCMRGLEQRYGKVEGKVLEQFEKENQVIQRMGFPAYFLIVQDFIDYARSKDIPVGPGRGSAAGSIVSYALGITNIDPLEYGLLFERFLNEGRKSMPDIDIDFGTEGRADVIRYVTEKYGRENVAQIITFGTMAARASIRDAGRVMDVPLKKVDVLAKKIPARPGITLEEALNEDAEFSSSVEQDPETRELFSVARRLEGQIRNVGTHAAGVIISDRPITEYCPLYRNGDDISTQFAMSDCEAIGLLKMDFLGLETLTQIGKTVALIIENGGTIDIESIPLDDPPTYKLLGRGDARGVFQLESEGMREILRKLRPDRFTDIIALVALYRPGPLGSGMVDQYIRVKHGEEQATYKHPILEPILLETNGVILYQEQVMRIAHNLAGFPLTDADNLRKAMGKKKPEIMARYRDQFIDGALEKDVDKKVVEEIWELIVFFAGYGFNKSHSAAYALIAYQTAYLKANFGTEFMAALMTTHMGNTDKLRVYLEECSQTDLEVSGPDVSRCRPHFSTAGEKKIRYGLGAIKGVGIRAAETIHQARKHRKDSFEDLFDFCESIDLTLVNKKVLESLAKAGAFDCLNIPRSTAFATIEKALRMGQRSQVDRARGQQSLFGEAPKPQATNEPETQVTAWTPRDQLTYEKEALGFYFSGHPLETDRNTLETFSTHSTRSLRDLHQKREVLVGGMIAEVIPTVVRNGRNAGAKMARILLEDLEGTCRVVIFHDLYKQHMEQLIPDEKLFVRGEFDEMATEPTILARALLPFEAAHATLTERVTVNLPGADTDQHLTALHKLIERHRGETPLFIKIPTRMGTVLIKTSDAFTIGPSPEFTREAHALVGEGCVRYSS